MLDRRGDRLFWKIIAVAAVIGLFMLGPSRPAPLGTPAFAQTLVPGTTATGQDLYITQSEDGRRLFVWSFERWDQDRLLMPAYLGVVEAQDE